MYIKQNVGTRREPQFATTMLDFKRLVSSGECYVKIKEVGGEYVLVKASQWIHSLKPSLKGQYRDALFYHRGDAVWRPLRWLFDKKVCS